MVGVARVTSKRGCRVRTGESLRSEVVSHLQHGALVSIRGDIDSDRVLIHTPCEGFVSKKMLASVEDASEDMLVRSNFSHFHRCAPDDELERRLEREEFRCLRGHGTEMAGTGEYNAFEPESGRFDCRACGLSLAVS